jgi:phosphoribosyl isomerase A
VRSRAISSRALTLLPALDIVAGRVDRAGDGGDDPLRTARAWCRAGASWLHLVDLDAAYGRPGNAELLATVIDGVDAHVELSAGVYDEESLRPALATGAARVVVGSAALVDLDWVASACARHGDRVLVALDVRDGRIAPRGAARGAVDTELAAVVARLDRAGCQRYVVTDVTRDGALSGPNLDLLRLVGTLTDRPLVASGGVSTLDDLRQLAGLRAADPAPRLEGVIAGRALHTGVFTIPEALAALQEHL